MTLSIPSVISAIVEALFKRIGLSLFASIERGRLTLILSDGTLCVFPKSEADQEEEPNAVVVVKRDTFWIRLATGGDVGFAEAYMFGDIDIPDLNALFALYILNRHLLRLLVSSPLSRLVRAITSPLHDLSLLSLRLTLGAQAQKDIAAHYDLSDAMFRAFLSKDMAYSCAIFPECDGDLSKSSPSSITTNGALTPEPSSAEVSASLPISPYLFRIVAAPTDSLDYAQQAKLSHLVDLLQIPPASSSPQPYRILEVGCGWGSLSFLIALSYPHVTIDALTLSSSQHAYVVARAEKLGLALRVHCHLMDFRAMPTEWTGVFERAVSIEMVEHVPPPQLRCFFSTLSRTLHPKRGLLLVQAINRTTPRPHVPFSGDRPDFLQKYIFPGGCLSSLEELLKEASPEGWVCDRVERIGGHYARTLREWRRKFERAWEDQLADAKEDGQETWIIPGEDGEIFRRKWRYYFCYCEAGFVMRVLDDHIITFTRKGMAGDNRPLIG